MDRIINFYADMVCNFLNGSDQEIEHEIFLPATLGAFLPRFNKGLSNVVSTAQAKPHSRSDSRHICATASQKAPKGGKLCLTLAPHTIRAGQLFPHYRQ